jgi:PAS domain S-box-containing protein
MPNIAVLETDAVIALDIAKSIEQANLASVDVFESFDELEPELAEQRFNLLVIDIGDNREEDIQTATRVYRDFGIHSIVISDHIASQSLIKLREAEPLGMLVKPFSSRELIANVETGLYRVSMEQKLRDSERRYRNLFAYSLSGRCISALDGTILERNTTFEVQFGSPEKVKNIQELFAEESIWDRVLDSLEKGHVLQEELRTRDSGNGARDVLSGFSYFQDEQNETRVLCEFIDITESKRLRDELFQSQKLEAIGRLAGGVAHDLNNFLTSMIGSLEMMKLDAGTSKEFAEDIAGMEHVIQKTSALTRQLLGFSRRKAFAPAVLDLREVLSDSYKMLKRLIPEKIYISLSLPDSPCVAIADAGHIEQILLNLVVNARDALETADNPRISILLTRVAAKREKAGKSLIPEGDYALIEVADNGIGIEPAVMEKIFEPFFTTKGEGKGTGLGLSIVSSLLDLNGGYIGAESTPGTGTTFRIWLPLAKGSETSEVSESSSVLPTENIYDHYASELNGKRILIVDDDESVLATCRRALERAGCLTEICVNAGEALLLFEHHTFDLLLVDIVLPGVNGTELWQRLKKSNSIVSCLYMTGYEPHSLGIETEEPILLKPFAPAALIEACAKAIERGRA